MAPSKKLDVLVVDDSGLYRSLLRRLFSNFPRVNQVYVAANGRTAVDIIAKKRPELVTLDLEMPEMDGLETLRVLSRRQLHPQVLMVSAHTREGAHKTLEALALGARDFITKLPGGASGAENLAFLETQLNEKLESLFDTAATRRRSARKKQRAESMQVAPEVLVIAVSTGGPNALSKVFSDLPLLPIPVLVVQHMPETFTHILAKRLDEVTPNRVVEATGGETPAPGTIYLAPGGKHLEVLGRNGRSQLSVHQGPKEHSCRPSADVLFRSAASTYGEACLALVMTGMGKDGCAGSVEIQRRGGSVMTQTAETCVVYGMPRAVHESGIPTIDVPLDQLGQTIAKLCERKCQRWTA